MPDQVVVTMPDGTQTVRTEPIIPARTSTKLAITGTTGLLLVQAIQSIHFGVPIIDAVVQSMAFASGFPLFVAWLTARFTKSPVAPQVL